MSSSIVRRVASGDVLPTRTVIWAAGEQANPLAAHDRDQPEGHADPISERGREDDRRPHPESKAYPDHQAGDFADDAAGQAMQGGGGGQ